MAMEEATDLSSQTNWIITYGSLCNCLTFQSSLSFEGDEEEQQESSTSKSLPLLLHSPSLDSPPCEITINFAKKHELRQIYVRSTARVYEIYCAPHLQSNNNEYLCTVRCGVAVRDGEVLRSLPIHQFASLPNNNNKDLGDENVKNEDDWVEVKFVDAPSQTKPYTEATQDLYEATAQIDDVDPCISVTIRLLSLQSKGCVYVDEIYVFGDPVDSEVQESSNENSSGSSLMAMFLPTLMQLSKSKGFDQLSAVTKEKQLVVEDGLEENPQLVDGVIKTQLKEKASIVDLQEVKSIEVEGGLAGPSQIDTLSQIAKIERGNDTVPSQAAQMGGNCSLATSKFDEMENNLRAVPSHVGVNQGDFSGGNVGRVLEQLVSRMDRLEEICLGFQEKMVVPMNSMQARLQRVEQQLDMLTKKLQNSALPSCSRICAPDASFIESDSNSCENCLHDTVTKEIESDKKCLHTEVPNVSPHDMSDSENTPQLLPGLVVTAPEFPDGEDEEDDASEQEMYSSSDKGKPSIDYALSSALANFVSSSLSFESPKYTKSLTVKAPDFSSEDEDDHENDNEIGKNDSVHLTDSEKSNHIQVLPSSNVSFESGEEVNRDFNDNHTEKTAPEAEEYDQFCGAEGDEDKVCVNISILAEHNPETGFNDNIEEDKKGEINGQESDRLSSITSEISNESLENQSPCGCNSIIQEGPSAVTELTAATEVPETTSHENIIENVLGFSLASCAVDFEVPLLDVKFISQRSSVTDGFLEALLVETPENSARDPSVQESSGDLSVKEQLKGNGDVSVEEQSNLISIDDGELVNAVSDSHFSLDEDLCTPITAAPVNTEGDNLLEDHKRKLDQIYTSSLI